MNLLIVGTDFPPFYGGISTYTNELANALSKTDQITVLAPGALNTKSFDLECPYRIIRTPPIPILRSTAFFIYIPYLLWRYHIDAVLHTVWPTSLVSHLWCFLFPTPYFVSVHASEILDDTRTWRRRLKSYLKGWRIAALRKAKCIFPVSNYTAGLVMSQGIDREKIEVISNGVNPQRFKPISSHHTGNKQKKMLTVARLDLHKGHDRVLEALAILKDRGFTPQYIIVGKGEEEIRLRKMVKNLGLESQVTFAGYVSESQLPEIYADSDIFVMASREIPGRLDLIEGFGISFLEASASGVPVVAGRSGGVSDAVRHEKTGLLVNPDDPMDIAKALQRLLENPDLASRLGNQGGLWVEAEMSWECVAERLRNIIKNLL